VPHTVNFKSYTLTSLDVLQAVNALYAYTVLLM
jgi:hypothetical protein